MIGTGVMRARRAWCGIAAAAAVLGGMAASQAQPLSSAPAEMAKCVCLERSMQTASGELQVRRQMYEDKRRQFAELEAEINRRRPLINTADSDQVDAFRRLIEQRDQQMVALRDTVTPAYADDVERYNSRVTAYNSACRGRVFDPQLLAGVRQTVVCPGP